MRKKIAVVSIIIGVLLVSCLTIVGIKLRNKQQTKQEALLNKQVINAENMLIYVAAEGKVAVQNGRVVITDLEFSEPDLILRLYYYNHETGSLLTLEQVKEQFDIYIINYEFSNENTKELQDFCNFVHERGLIGSRITSSYTQYIARVFKELKNMQTDINTATREQLEEACKKALEE